MKSDKDKFGEFVGDTFIPTQDSGFFSICSLVLFELSRTPNAVKRIDATNVFLYFSPLKVDAWPLFFQIRPQPEVRNSKKNPFARRRRNHSVYSDLPIYRARKHLLKYFSPSEEVLHKKKRIVDSYSITPKNTLVICYRGTDKHVEVPPEPIESYIAAARKILRRNPRLRVMVQTDQEQVRQRLLSEFGAAAFSIEELPTTLGNTVIHKLIEEERKVDFGRSLLASVLIMASSKYVISHTGNMSLWIALYRGSTRRFIQMGAHRFVNNRRPVPQILTFNYWLNVFLSRKGLATRKI